MQFIDRVELSVKAGDGGDGIVAWLREAHLEFGGPSGGDGGRGGSIRLIADPNETTLLNFSHATKIEAENGGKGGTKDKSGRAGKDIDVKVPVGTVVIDKKTGQTIVDLDEPGKTFLIARGGAGGRGNASFLSNQNKAPKMYERGDLGEERELVFELKVLADVGLVGAPNAGKSTLLSKISAARPKVANYPFTTLIPVLGTVRLKGNRSFVVADIPGLIEGASKGAGLGIDFLKHIERCKCLLHLVSMDPVDNDDPWKTFQTVAKEMAHHGNLKDKPFLVVATKMDSLGAADQLTKFEKKIGRTIWAISALVDPNQNPLLEAAYKLYAQDLKKAEELKPLAEHVTYGYDDHARTGEGLLVRREDDGTWTVESPRLHYWHRKIPQTNPDNIIRFNQKMESEGVFSRMKELGAKRGETLRIYGDEFIYE